MANDLTRPGATALRGCSEPRETAGAEVSARALLTTIWILPPNRHGPLGFGVTAHSFDDAPLIIRKADRGDSLPEDVGSPKIPKEVRFAHPEHPRVQEHLGPIDVRGLWHPFPRIGTNA